MSFSTEGLARACAVHPKRTVAAWLAVVLASFVVIAVLLGGALTTDGDVTSNPESKQAEALIHEGFPPGRLRARSWSCARIASRSTIPRSRRRCEALGERGEALGIVAEAQSYYASDDESLVSKDRHATMVPLVMRGDEVAPLVELVQAENGQDGFEVSITGSLTADADFEKLSEEDLQKGELLIGLPAALIMLVLVFGAVVAGLVPVLLGLLSIVVAVALTALVGQAFEVSFFVVNMISAMGLALGIDYALFILSRFREERGRGLEKIDAIVASGATASRAVLFSGIAFVLAMCGMLLVPDTVLRSLALGAILVGIVSVAAALTLLPAVLSLLGDRVNAGRVPLIGRRAINSAGSEGPFWSALVGGVMRRPLLSLVAATALLLAMAIPVLSIDTGFSGLSTLPDRFPSKQGFDALHRDFPGAGVDPAQIVIQGDVASAPVQIRDRRTHVEPRRPGRIRLAQRARLRRRRHRRALGAGRGRRRRPRGDRCDPPPSFRPDPGGVRRARGDRPRRRRDRRERRLLRHRRQLAPDRVRLRARPQLHPADDRVPLDRHPRCRDRAQPALGRSRLRPARARLPEGRRQRASSASSRSTRSRRGCRSSSSPSFSASRWTTRSSCSAGSRSATRRPATPPAPISFGVGSTARLITGAALIIIAVFGGFAAGDLVMFQQMGFGVAVALLVDATIVRSVLVPASMKLLGDRNWYLPSWLSWLPDVHVEGHVTAKPATNATTKPPEILPGHPSGTPRCRSDSRAQRKEAMTSVTHTSSQPARAGTPAGPASGRGRSPLSSGSRSAVTSRT